MARIYEVIGKEKKARLNLHPGQTRAWDSEHRFVFMFAGTQGG